MRQDNSASGVGLERLCRDDWMRSAAPTDGVELLEAWFQGHAYRPHRHDTYAISLTTRGIQTFTYRGALESSLPGQVTVLHPDEVHDGHAGTEAGFGYRMLYIDPALIFAAIQTLCGHPCPLPFVRSPVLTHPMLATAITNAFVSTREPLAMDSLLMQLAEGLIEADPRCRPALRPRYLDVAAIHRARAFLDAQNTRIVRSAELEAVTGLTRYDLARQFRALCGTSPYRYALLRRLDNAREQLTQGRPIVEVAIDVGFADQAHFSRFFTSTIGITPARYRTLSGLGKGKLSARLP
jgi:AraC-like DNA-binding protein